MGGSQVESVQEACLSSRENVYYMHLWIPNSLWEMGNKYLFFLSEVEISKIWLVVYLCYNLTQINTYFFSASYMQDLIDLKE